MNIYGGPTHTHTHTHGAVRYYVQWLAIGLWYQKEGSCWDSPTQQSQASGNATDKPKCRLTQPPQLDPHMYCTVLLLQLEAAYQSWLIPTIQ